VIAFACVARVYYSFTSLFRGSIPICVLPIDALFRSLGLLDNVPKGPIFIYRVQLYSPGFTVFTKKKI